MSIDGIGRGGPPAPGAGVGGVAAGEVGGAGALEAAQNVSGAEAARGSEALGQLERGEIALPQYLDQTVSQALQHLSGQLSPEQLGFVRTELRRQLENDPALRELVRRSTGQLPAGED